MLMVQLTKSLQDLWVCTAVADRLDTRNDRGINHLLYLLGSLRLPLHSAMRRTLLTHTGRKLTRESLLAPSDVLWRCRERRGTKKTLVFDHVERAGDGIRLALIQRLN